MKVQYFGDKHDFRKYALLRKLAGEGGFKIGVCWMLTPDDGHADGGMRAYLDEGQTSRWRHFDSELYDLLAPVSKGSLSNAGLGSPTYEHFVSIEGSGLIKGAKYVNACLTYPPHQELITDAQLQGLAADTRIRRYFHEATGWFSNGESQPELIFFDPDNGLEVPTYPITRAKSYKYLYLQEAKKFFSAGQSLIIYQHFRFISRDVFVPRIKCELSAFLGGCTVEAFETPNVLFLVAIQPEHEARVQQVLDFVGRDWPRQKNFVWLPERPAT